MYISGNDVGGIFDFASKILGGAVKTSSAIVQGKQVFDATKSAWKGVPYAYPSQNTFPSYAPPVSTSAPAIPNRTLTRDEIARLQSTLNNLGFNTGAVDGVYGPNTRNGIMAFQRARGMTADGLPTSAVYNEAMKIAAPAASGANAQAPIWQTTFPGYSIPPAPPLRETPIVAPASGFNVASLSQFALPAAVLGAVLLLTQKRGR